MILVAPDGPHPLAERAASENRLAVASYMVAQALEGMMPWDACWRALDDRALLWRSEEVVKLQHIIDAAHNPIRTQRALFSYIKYLSRSEGLTRCALYFAEITRTLAGDAPSVDLLVELATLYRQETRFIEAGDVWAELELRGQDDGNDWLVLRSKLGTGMIARHLGNLGKAERIFLTVSAEARDYLDLRAMARNNLGTVYDHMHPPRYTEAAREYWSAYALHPEESDRLQSLMNVGTAAVGCQNYTLADFCFRIVSRTSECWQDITNCLIERLDVCSALRAWDEVAELKKALRFRLDRLTPDMMIDYRYRLGLAELRRGGNPALHWEEARQMAREHQLWEWDAKLAVVLTKNPDPPEPVESPQLERAYLDCMLYCMTGGY
jgi:tetratricopeptide (TPR) repeat protein